jgi:curved DNA-binding protein CbpA
MLLKKSTIALCSSGSLSSALPAAASITSSTGPSSTSTSTSIPRSTSPPSWAANRRTRSPRSSQLCPPSQWRSSRPYATVRDEPRPHDDDPTSPAWPKSKDPTPYEIFDQAKSSPYNKKTFYQLVKLYHPDRHVHTSGLDGSITQKAKLERYRLVVAANDILSNPTKRRAYDLYGAGWGGASEMSNTAYREADRAWRAQAGTAAHNATWEDWERWHWEKNGRRDGAAGRSEPRYMSNGLFVMTICVFVILGGWGQATRAGNHGMYLVEMQDKKDNHISEEMWRRRKEKALLTREDRVENFLRSREGWDTAVNDSYTPKG